MSVCVPTGVKFGSIASTATGNWQEELQKYIHPDELPQAFGGNRCEPDPQCTAYVSQPACIPLTLSLLTLSSICLCYTAQPRL